MSNARLSKFYLVPPTSFDKIKTLNKPKNSEKNNKRAKNGNSIIDYFKKLKNIQRKFIYNSPNSKTKSQNNEENLHKVIMTLVSHLDLVKNNGAKAQIPKQVQFNLQKEISRVVKQLKNANTQTNSTEMVDQKLQTDWEEDSRAEELSNLLNRSLSFLEPIREEDENVVQSQNEVEEEENKDRSHVNDEEFEDVDESDDEEDVTMVERVQTPRRNNNSARTFLNFLTTPLKTPVRMQTTPAKTPKRTPQRKIGKHLSTPLNLRANKLFRPDDSIRISKSNKKILEKMRKKRIAEVRKAKITGMRTAKIKAYEQLKKLKSWKRI